MSILNWGKKKLPNTGKTGAYPFETTPRGRTIRRVKRPKNPVFGAVLDHKNLIVLRVKGKGRIIMGKSKGEMTPARLERNRLNPEKHGGGGAVRRIEKGLPFVGIAAQAQNEVENKLAEVGESAIVRETAVRLQTASELYWAAVCKAAESGDLVALDRYVARYGWLAGCALRAWAQVKIDKKDKGTQAIDVLAAIRGKDDKPNG